MKNLIQIIALSLISSGIFASHSINLDKNLICAYQYAQEIKDELALVQTRDKFLHCSVSCAVGLRCGLKSSAILGLAKEVYDVFGPGHAEFGDLYANLRGLSLSRSQSVNDLSSCKEACSKLYSNELFY